MATHLPPDEMIADFACGATSPGVSLLMAAHMTQVPATCFRVAQYEGLGGSLLRDVEPAGLGAGALDAVLAQIADPAETPCRRDLPAKGPVPTVVLDRAGIDFDDIVWRRQLPGVASYDLGGFEDEHVSLLRARPGAKVPQHTHEDVEMTLVLQGLLYDGGVEYAKVDIAINDEDDDHRPEVRGDETCYCLIVRHGHLTFTGRLSRFLNYLGE